MNYWLASRGDGWRAGYHCKDTVFVRERSYLAVEVSSVSADPQPLVDGLFKVYKRILAEERAELALRETWPECGVDGCTRKYDPERFSRCYTHKDHLDLEPPPPEELEEDPDVDAKFAALGIT